MPTPKDKAPDPKARYTILHTAVEGFFRGQTVTLEHLKMGLARDIDLGRLVRLGAIAPEDSNEAARLRDEMGPDARTPEDVPVREDVPMPAADITNPQAETPA